MKKRRITLLIVAVLLVALIAVGATLAYFTDSDSAGNVVNMGHVDISLTETSNSDKATAIDEHGITFDGVLPGDTLNKVPTVTVQSGSADCYVRVNMTITAAEGSTITADDIAALKAQLISQITEDGTWAYNATEDSFYYTASLTAGSAVDLFQSVTIPAAWKNNVADQSFTIQLQAEAIQASYITFDSTNVCWADAEGNDLTDIDIQQYVAQINP